MATSIKFVDEGTVYGGEDRAGDESSSDSESGEEECDERKKKATEKKKMKQTTGSLCDVMLYVLTCKQAVVNKEIIDGYVTKGFTRKLTPEEAAVPVKKQWFLPHHPVLNPNKPGKEQMVMDARAKYNGVSLNDELLVGPDLLNNLCGVLLRFREERVAIAADIESMFHQCLIIEQDQPALRFLWHNLETNRDPASTKCW
ncbi:hypothetical protein ACROYT_G021531 [Oculina patagonica]